MVLNEEQLKSKISQIYREEQISIIKERWVTLSSSERKFIIEFVKTFKPKESEILSENKWWNTIGDVVGIFDPTGIVDIINGLDYIRQGDHLFGIMSLISAVPYIGDLVGKPIILILKSGKQLSKTLKSARTAAEWVSLGQKYPIIKKLLDNIGKIYPKLIQIMNNVPGGKGFINVIESWVGKNGILTKASKQHNPMVANKLLKTDIDAFRTFGINDFTGLKRMWKKGGLFKNRQLSRLLVKTKFYMRFLDYIGVGNFVGPDEVIKRIGENQFNRKMDEYMMTPEAKSSWDEIMPQTPQSTPKIETPQPPPDIETPKQDPIYGILSLMLGGTKLTT